jgi:MraZ protein
VTRPLRRSPPGSFPRRRVLLKHASIEKNAVLVGSLTKFNIYSPARWQQEEQRTAGENFGDLMRRLDI